jgi:hypothetical protein
MKIINNNTEVIKTIIKIFLQKFQLSDIIRKKACDKQTNKYNMIRDKLS